MSGSQKQNDQSWHNPRSAWLRKIRLLWMGHALIAIGMLAVGTFFLYLSISLLGDDLFWSAREESFTTIMLVAIMMILPAIVFPVISIALAQRVLRTRRLAREVPAAEGNVCPWCYRHMTCPGNTQADDACESTMVSCASCDWKCDAVELRQAWVNYALNMTEFAEWQLEHHPNPDRWLVRWRANQLANFYGEKKQNLPSHVTWGMFATLLAVGLWFFSVSLFHAIMFGVFLIAFNLLLEVTVKRTRRKEVTRHCAGCHYQVAPKTALTGQCPECAADWSDAGAVYTQRRNMSTKQQFVFAMVIPLAFALIFFVFMYAGGYWPGTNRAPGMTTGELIEEVTTGRGYLSNEWGELRTRELNEQQILLLAEGLLERRVERATLFQFGDQWFLDAIADDLLPDDIVDRYYSGIIQARLLAPEQARVGEPMTIGIENTNRYSAVGTHTPAVFFAGFEFGDTGESCCRSERPQRYSHFGSRVSSYGSGAFRPSSSQSRTEYTPTQPGQLTIRARYWLAGIPSGRGVMMQSVEWNPDGSPEFPEGTAWSYKFVMEHTVQVVE